MTANVMTIVVSTRRRILTICALRFRLGLQLDTPFGEFDGKFHILAVKLLADLRGLLLHEGGEGIEVAGNTFSRFLFGSDQSVVQALHLFALGLIHGAVQGERLRSNRRRGRSYC